MKDKAAQDKKNFLTWYEGADYADIQKAIRHNRVKFFELLKEYKRDKELQRKQ